jgi:hypothetical protein
MDSPKEKEEIHWTGAKSLQTLHLDKYYRKLLKLKPPKFNSNIKKVTCAKCKRHAMKSLAERVRHI